jgi:uncharacterized protein YhbP (UPF0306 family)
MAIERDRRPVPAARLRAAARRLLDASTLCAISTLAPKGRAYINTAYFAWSADFELVWISEPGARHSRNIRARPTVAIAVYDSSQTWGDSDRGIQLFGSAHEVEAADAGDAEVIYAGRFADYRRTDLGAYRFYAFRPRRLKLFDEHELGAGTFVTARVTGPGRLAWERTEIYRSES